jgi:hypothetical protein
MMIRIIASQYTGIAAPANEKVVSAMSSFEYWRTAWSVPSKTARTSTTRNVVPMR